MKVERQEIGTVEILSPQGVLTEDDAEEFSTMLQRRLAGANPRVAVSLSDVPYMDSTALNALLEAAEELADRGTRLKLVSVNPTCRETLELTGLSPRFQFFENPQDAVRSFLQRLRIGNAECGIAGWARFGIPQFACRTRNGLDDRTGHPFG